MQLTETEYQFRFDRGQPLAGWLLTGAVLITLLYFLEPLLAWEELLLPGEPLDHLRQTVREASAGEIGIGTALIALGGLVVLSAVNRFFASSSIVFDKETGQMTRGWRLGLLRRNKSYPFETIRAIGCTVASRSFKGDETPSWSIILKCYFQGGKSYELMRSGDPKAIGEVARRLRRFLKLPTDGELNVERQPLAPPVSPRRPELDEIKDKERSPPIRTFDQPMSVLPEAMVQGLEPRRPAIGNDTPPDELLGRLRASPVDTALHLKVAALLRAQNRHAEAAAVLEGAVDLMARAAGTPDPRYSHAEPTVPHLLRAHPIRAETVRELWAQVREKPDDAGRYFLLAVSLRTLGWQDASRACANHAVQMRLAIGAITAAEADELRSDFGI